MATNRQVPGALSDIGLVGMVLLRSHRADFIEIREGWSRGGEGIRTILKGSRISAF